MVDTLGGTMTAVASDEQLAGAFDDVAQPARRVSSGSPSRAPAGADDLGPLTVTAGDATTVVAYAGGAVRTGSDGLAPLDRRRFGRLASSPTA